MKIQNFREAQWLPNEIDSSGTVYRGKIKMTYDEYCKAVKYLMRSRIGEKYEWIGVKNMLKKDLERKISIKGNGFVCAIRVPATMKLVQKYALEARYKQQNYYLEIMPE